MSSLLHCACRFQAAVKAYNSVKDFADRKKWKAQFANDRSKLVLAFRQAKAEHPDQEAPNLHPLVKALGCVLDLDSLLDSDFSIIAELYDRVKLKYYKHAPDLPPFVPPREDCWWEDLAAEDRSRQMLRGPVDPEEQDMHEEPAAVEGHANPEPAVSEESAAPKEPAAPVPRLPTFRSRKSKILPPKTPSKRQGKPAETTDTPMAVDEPTKRRLKRKAAETIAPPKSSKRRTRPLWLQDQVSAGSDAADAGPSPLTPNQMTLESGPSEAPLTAPAMGSSLQALSSTKVAAPLPSSSRSLVQDPPIQIDRQRSPTAVPQSSNDGQSLTARITALEENWKEVAAIERGYRQNLTAKITAQEEKRKEAAAIERDNRRKLTARVTALEETINQWKMELAAWKEDIDCKLEDDEL